MHLITVDLVIIAFVNFSNVAKKIKKNFKVSNNPLSKKSPYNALESSLRYIPRSEVHII